MFRESFFAMQGARWRQVVRRGDIIFGFGQKNVETMADLVEELRGSRSGDVRQLVFYSFGMDRMKYLPLKVDQLHLN